MLDIAYERSLLAKGYDSIVGIDEVGRGSWAGPLYVCAYVINRNSEEIKGVFDSKLLTARQRVNVAQSLIQYPFLLKIISNREIDRLGLGGCMRKAILDLISESITVSKGKKIKYLVDGYFKGSWNCDVEFIPKGDKEIYCIAAASIIAKVKRDDWMKMVALKFPGYDFENNVGYGTQKHIDAIQSLGICDIHRTTYKPIRQFILNI